MLPGAQSTQVMARFFRIELLSSKQEVRSLPAALVHRRATEGLDVHGDLLQRFRLRLGVDLRQHSFNLSVRDSGIPFRDAAGLRMSSGPEGVHRIPVFDQEPELSDLATFEAKGKRLERTVKLAPFSLRVHSDQRNGVLVACQNLDRFDANGAPDSSRAFPKNPKTSALPV